MTQNHQNYKFLQSQIKDHKGSKSRNRLTARTSQTSSDHPMYDLINLMSSVRSNPEETKLNVTTISDGKGGRIFL